MDPRALQLVVADDSFSATVSRAQRGSRVDQERVLKVLAPRVATVLRRTLGPDVELDDLAQDALAEFLLSMRRLRAPDQAVLFAERIAVNLARSRLRRRRVLRFLGFDDLVSPESEPDDPATRLAAVTGPDHEARQALVDCTSCSSTCTGKNGWPSCFATSSSSPSMKRRRA